MAGLGLQNAVMAYQQGRAWRENQDQLELQKAKRDRINAANKAGSEVMTQAQAQHEAEQAAALEGWTKEKGTNEGFQAAPFQMNENVMLNALNARSAALAKGGDWEDWMGNEAKAAPLREQVRTKTFDAALKQYEMDGDPIALAEKVYPAIYDGRKIVRPIVGTSGGKGGGAATNAALAESNAQTGLAGASSASEAGPETIRFELSDGSMTKPMTHEQLVERVKWASLNPSQVRDYEIKKRLQDAQLEFERNKQKARGEQDRETERVKGSERRGLAAIVADREDARAKADRESAERQTGARVSATRYSADQGVAAAKVRTKGAGKDDRTKAFSDLHDEVRKTVGKQAMGAFGGTKMADEDTLNMARYAEALMDNDESLGSGDAISKAVAEFKKRKPTTTDAEE